MANAYRNFAGKDFSSEFERLIEILKQELPELSDYNASDAGISLIRLLARETDQLNFYLDRAFEEGSIYHARFRQSLIDLARTVGYLPELMSHATTTLTLTRISGVSGDITVPKHTIFKRTDGIQYLSSSEVVLPDGENTVSVSAVQGIVVSLQVNPSEFTVSDRSSRPRYSLGTGVAAGSVEVSHGNPVIVWTEVDSFWRSQSSDYHFLTELNGDDDSVWLILGDGTQGQSVPSTTLNISFILTDGSLGNCGHSVITVVPESLEASITCINRVIATGGAASESITSMRRQIPAVTRTQRRAVNLEDYTALIEHVPGVLHVQAIDRTTNPEYPHLHVVLYCVPDGGGALTEVLREDILSVCREWGHLGSWNGRYILKDVTEVPVSISCRIGIDQGYVFNDVSATVRTALQNLLSTENRTIGGSLTYSELNLAINAVSSVSWVTITNPIQDTVVSAGQIVSAGTITITQG